MTSQSTPKRVITLAQWVAADAALREAISRFASQARFEEEFLRAFLIYWSAEDAAASGSSGPASTSPRPSSRTWTRIRRSSC